MCKHKPKRLREFEPILKANGYHEIRSRGSHFIYDGTFQGRKIQGMGITATLLKRHGIEVMSEDEFLANLNP